MQGRCDARLIVALPGGRPGFDTLMNCRLARPRESLHVSIVQTAMGKTAGRVPPGRQSRFRATTDGLAVSSEPDLP